MSDGKKTTTRWTDGAGTEWHVRRREAAHGLRPGWIMRRVGYSLVAWDDSGDEPTPQQLQSYVDSHMSRKSADADGTARLWTDPRNGTEWEVFEDDDDLVFQRGIEEARASRDYGSLPPRSMNDDELKAALDRARGGE